jgi:tetratricopeptide (TPR) repeat protein
MSSNYNSAQGFHVGKSTAGKAQGDRRSKGVPVRREDPNSEAEAMVWSPMETDSAPSSVVNGFSVGKHEDLPSSRARRGLRDSVPIPNIRIASTVGVQGTLQSSSDRINEFRRKGNHAFKMKDYERACAKYSSAIVSSLSLPELEKAGLPLLYCNRAAAYLALGKPIEALEDCRSGMNLSPVHRKCRFRAVTCLVRMGRFTEARGLVRGVVGTQTGSNRIEDSIAAEVAKRTQEIDEAEKALVGYLDTLADGRFGTMEALKTAYKEVEAHVPHAEALVVSLVVAHIQFGDFSGADRILDVVLKQRGSNPPAWAGWCRVQTCFFKADYLQCGRNLEALDGLLKRQATDGTGNAFAAENQYDGSVSRVLTLPDRGSVESMSREIGALQGLKDQAHGQMYRGAFNDAIETYSRALSSPQMSPAMAAILFSNRAASYQSVGQHALALADCCMAVAISPHFAKPHSRMAGLLFDLGLYLDAQKSIERAVACAATSKQRSEYQNAKNSISHHRRQQMDHTRLLGLHHSASVVDGKRAYRKLALKLHPDKTSQATNRIQFQLSEAGSRLWTAEETRHQVLEQATWLFKQLGEAQDAMTSSFL